ncbi:uncharacterized protein LOC127356915 [Dicentrarchus labrax]|uniref:uncharacterized protein LOC127356915 n=1 Tax=Dicentrarchus labrax TaxID=13489 RepID=UPI0021F51875|nr:uncharacterized protein LOC127356915 [Dicentrarchus labrax]
MHTLSSGSEHTHCFGEQQRKLTNCRVVSLQHLSAYTPQAQATLSSAVGLTMPQPTQNSLIHVLLLWTTTLSIIQAVFIILFFTTGHRGLSQNNSAVAPERTVQSQANNTASLPPSDHGLLLGEGTMLTYKAIEAKGGMKWSAMNPNNDLVSVDGKDLKINRDGYYFLNLQVTLKKESKECEEQSDHNVSLKWNNKVVLMGGINKNTCTTGLLGKVEELSAGGTLVFNISLPTTEIDDIEHLTHLDIIYMLKP